MVDCCPFFKKRKEYFTAVLGLVRQKFREIMYFLLAKSKDLTVAQFLSEKKIQSYEAKIFGNRLPKYWEVVDSCPLLVDENMSLYATSYIEAQTQKMPLFWCCLKIGQK